MRCMLSPYELTVSRAVHDMLRHDACMMPPCMHDCASDAVIACGRMRSVAGGGGAAGL